MDIPLGGGGGSLHVVEPELLLHVTIRHLAKGLLVVLHELEDGRQLLFLNSVEKKGYRGERCSYPRCDRERERDAASLLGGRTPLSRISAFAFQSKGKTKPKRDPRKTRELVRSKKLNSRVLNIGVLSLSFALEIWGPPSYRGFSVLPFPLEPLFRVARTSHSAAGGRRYVLVSGWRPCEEIGQKQRWTSQSGGRRSTRGWEIGERWTHMHEGAGGGGECLLLKGATSCTLHKDTFWPVGPLSLLPGTGPGWREALFTVRRLDGGERLPYHYEAGPATCHLASTGQLPGA